MSEIDSYLLSEAAREAYQNTDSRCTYIDTLTIMATGMESIRVCQGYGDFVAPSGHTYYAYNFEFRLPQLEVAAEPILEIMFGNVSRVIGDKIALSVNNRIPVYVDYKGFVIPDSGGAFESERMLLPMRAKSARIPQDNAAPVVVRCGWESLQNIKFPRRMISTQRYRGLII